MFLKESLLPKKYTKSIHPNFVFIILGQMIGNHGFDDKMNNEHFPIENGINFDEFRMLHEETKLILSCYC